MVSVVSFIAKENPRSYIAFSFYVSLVVFNLGWYLSLSLYFLTLTFLKNISLLFCRMLLSLDLSNCFLMIRFMLCTFGRNINSSVVEFFSMNHIKCSLTFSLFLIKNAHSFLNLQSEDLSSDQRLSSVTNCDY